MRLDTCCSRHVLETCSKIYSTKNNKGGVELAQFAVHIATGILAGDLLKGDRSLRYGLVLGSIAPDLDFIPLIAVYLLDPDLARSFHRSASHSLLLPVLILIVSLPLYVATHKKAILGWSTGLAIGLVSHIILDILFWFEAINVLWPLDALGFATKIDLWKYNTPSEIIVLLLGPAAEFLFYGLLFYFLRRRALYFQTNIGLLSILRKLEFLLYTLFLVYIFLAFQLPRSTYEEVVYGVTALFFGPLTLYLLWKMRTAIKGPAI